MDNFALPGDATFPLNAHYAPPANRNEAGDLQAFHPPTGWYLTGNYFLEYLRQYLTQVRQELAARLTERLYADGTGKPSKWWMSFQKRRFMNRSLGS